MVGLCGFLGLSLRVNVSAQGQRSRTASNAVTAVSQQPLYSEYRGVRLGMTAEEARARLGKPALKDVDQDFYIFSDNESTQIAYDADHRVVTISTDYTEGIGAPDYRAVVGDVNAEQRQNGLYRIASYPRLGFWVSYNRTVGPMVIVTVTIQRCRVCEFGQ
jgi:hypothetical protein